MISSFLFLNYLEVYELLIWITFWLRLICMEQQFYGWKEVYFKIGLIYVGLFLSELIFEINVLSLGFFNLKYEMINLLRLRVIDLICFCLLNGEIRLFLHL